MNMSTANIFASIIFGSIGLDAFIYGKKQANFKALIIGVLLMAYPYFVTNAVAAYVIGILALIDPTDGKYSIQWLPI